MCVFRSPSIASSTWAGLAALACLAPAPAKAFDALQYVPDVNAFNGKHAGIFHGASLPFGMMMWAGGAPSVFTQFSGSGMPPDANEDINMLGVAGGVKADYIPDQNGLKYADAGKAKNSGTPGNYRTELPDGSAYEAAATTRCALFHFTFPKDAGGTLLFSSPTENNFKAHWSGEVVGDREVRVSINKLGRNWTNYLVLKFEKPFAAFGVFTGPADIRAGMRKLDGGHGVYVTFDAAAAGDVRYQVGESFVGFANAQLNLDAELPDFDFDRVKAEASRTWNDALSKIQVEGASDLYQRSFYTQWSHCLFHPNVFSDVNGDFWGFDYQVHRATGYTHYTSFSGWDIYHCWPQLVAQFFPQQLSDMMHSLVVDAAQGGGGLPRWVAGNSDRGNMSGDPDNAIIMGAYLFGARAFSLADAVAAMENDATTPGVKSGRITVRPGLDFYLAKGWVPGNLRDGPGGSLSIDYTVADFCLAQGFHALGNDTKANAYLKRAQNWRHVFNRASGLLDARDSAGNFLPPDKQRDPVFNEGDSKENTWLMNFNLKDLIDSMGGPRSAIAKLDSTMIGSLGNENSITMPFAYDWTGEAWRAQKAIHQIAGGTIQWGINGQDDLGGMSSWLIWGMLGIFPAVPGLPGVLLHGSYVPKITFTTALGKTVQILREAAAPDDFYVQTVTVNGKPYTKTWLALEQLDQSTNVIKFTMGNTSSAWGSVPADMPPSYNEDGGFPAIPAVSLGHAGAGMDAPARVEAGGWRIANPRGLDLELEVYGLDGSLAKRAQFRGDFDLRDWRSGLGAGAYRVVLRAGGRALAAWPITRL